MKARAIVVRLVALAIGLAIPLVLIDVALQFAPVATGLGTQAVDAENPVVRFEPGRAFVWSKGAMFDIVNRGRVNAAGFVSDVEYDASATTPLLAVVGDSYVEAAMVAYRDTLHARIDRAYEARLRVYPFGASGASLAQYLAFARHARDTYRPDAFLFVIVANDFDESWSAHGARPGFHHFTRPSDGEVSLERTDFRPSTLRALLRRSALARYVTINLEVGALPSRLFAAESEFAGNVAVDVDPEREADARAAVGAFFGMLDEATGVPPSRVAFVLDGVRPQLYARAGGAEVVDTYFDRMRERFARAAAEHGNSVLDLQPAFERVHRDTGARLEFENDGHWNALGHGVAAREVVASGLVEAWLDAAAQSAKRPSADPVSRKVVHSSSGSAPIAR